MKRSMLLVSILVALSLVLAACQTPAATTPAPAEPTQAPAAPTEPPAAPTEPPAEPEPPVEVIPTEFPRAETLYVSGAAWGPASTWNPFQPGSLANTKIGRAHV